MDNSNRGLLPVIKGVKLSVTQCPTTAKEKEEMSSKPYASAIGSLMYAMLCTRPDLALAISMTNCYHSNPGMTHWIAVKNILKYLRRTNDLFLVYGGVDEELTVKGYVDASLDSDLDDSKSQTGYVFMLNGGAIIWRSGKQSVVAQSSMESEYIASCEASNEVLWLKKFVIELGVFPSYTGPVGIFRDNKGAIANAKEPRIHSTSKHILRKFHVT